MLLSKNNSTMVFTEHSKQHGPEVGHRIKVTIKVLSVCAGEKGWRWSGKQCQGSGSAQAH